MVITRSPRITLSLDLATMGLLTHLQKFTGLSPAQAIQKLLPQHFGELSDYLAWLEGLDPKDGSVKSQLGPFLMHSIGPDTLPQAMKKLDPTYEFAKTTPTTD